MMVALAIFVSSIIYDLFYSKEFTDWNLLIQIVVWLAIVIIYSMKSFATILVILVYLVMLSGFYIFAPASPSLERLCTIIYLFLFFVVIQQLIECKSSR